MKRTLTICCAIGLGLTLGAATCKDSDEAQKKCEGVMCTMMFAAVTVQVTDASGAPVLLDSTVTTGRRGALSFRGKAGAGGLYTVVDDSRAKELALRTEAVVFKGYKNGQEIVREEFVVKADCCHVSKDSGPDVIAVK